MRVAKVVEADGNVSVVVSDADGNSTQEMITDVETELENWRAAGPTLTVVGGTRVEIDLTVSITDYRTGFDVAQNADTIEAAMAARIDRLTAGQTMSLNAVRAAAFAAFPDDVYEVEITAITQDGSPVTVADIVPASSEVLRSGTVTVS